MNDDRINGLIENIKNNPSPSQEAVNDFIKNNLTDSQAQAVQNVMKNPGLLKSILQSPQAKQLIEKLKNQREE